MNKTIMYACLFTAVVISSCSKSIEMTGERNGVSDNQILVSPTISKISGLTRSPYIETSPNKDFTADILISEAQGEYTTLWNTGNTAAGNPAKDGSTFGFTGNTVKWPNVVSQKAPLYFTGLSPAKGFTIASTDGKSATATIDGKTDFMYTNEVKKEDKTAVQMNFSHTLMLCKLYVRAESQQAIDDWGKLTDIKLTGVQYDNETAYGQIAKTLTVNFGSTAKFTLADKTLPTLPLFAITNTVPETYTDVAFSSLVPKMDMDQVAGYVMVPVSNASPTVATDPDDSHLSKIQFELTSDKYNGTGEEAPRIAEIDLSKATYRTSGSAIYVRLLLQAHGRISFDQTTIDGWGDAQDVPGKVGE
ncbi:MAG: hypothetical protein LBN24_00415 [Mediterranea sp.]|jgi:hypothetical protein|nr:hypothetical protein [Mediterranea sp.]